MNKNKLLLLLLSPAATAIADDLPAAQSNAEEARRFELNVAGSYSVGILDHSSRKPGLGLFLGYKLSPWSTLGLKFDSRGQGGRGAHLDFEEYTLSYRRWLALGRWSPYLQAGAGYGRVRYAQAHSTGYGTEMRNVGERGDFAFQLGGGYRYSLTRDVGLDLGLHYHGIGSPWNFHDKYLVSKIGLDVSF